MAKLKGNIWDLVKNAAQQDKREQLIPEKKSLPKKTYSQPWPEPLKSVDEEYVRVRLELPKSLKEEIDRYFFENKMKGKNEFLFHAIKEYAHKKGINWSER